MPYIGQSLTEGTRREYNYVATAGQTVFPAIYTVGAVDVHQNGILLPPSDYTATDGTTVVFATGCAVDDEVVIHCHNTFSVADTYTKSASDDRFVNASGDTMTGTLSVTGGRLYVGQTAGDFAQFGKDTNGNAFIDATQSDADFGIYINSTSTGYNKKLGIDSSGRITNPYQPAFLAYGSKAKTAYIWEDVSHAFTSTRYNIGNHYNTSNGRFTAPIAGRYCFYAGGYSPNSTNGARYAWAVTVNAGPQEFIAGANYSTIDSPLAGYSIIQNLNAGDFVRLEMFSELTATIGNATHTAYFGGYLLG